MRHFFWGTGVASLVLAMLMWAKAPAIAAEHGHVEFAHAAGVGSIHFAPREVPVHAGPVAPVRPGHVEVAAPPKGAYRNPYRDDYFKRFPAGYHPFVLNGAQYYGYYSLPIGYTQSVLNGITYFLFGGLYYQPYIYGGQTVYVVVPPPV